MNTMEKHVTSHHCDYCTRELSKVTKKVSASKLSDANHWLGSWFTECINMVSSIDELNGGEHYSLSVASMGQKRICSSCYFRNSKVFEQKHKAKKNEESNENKLDSQSINPEETGKTEAVVGKHSQEDVHTELKQSATKYIGKRLSPAEYAERQRRNLDTPIHCNFFNPSPVAAPDFRKALHDKEDKDSHTGCGLALVEEANESKHNSDRDEKGEHSKDAKTSEEDDKYQSGVQSHSGQFVISHFHQIHRSEDATSDSRRGSFKKVASGSSNEVKTKKSGGQVRQKPRSSNISLRNPFHFHQKGKSDKVDPKEDIKNKFDQTHHSEVASSDSQSDHFKESKSGTDMAEKHTKFGGHKSSHSPFYVHHEVSDARKDTDSNEVAKEMVYEQISTMKSSDKLAKNRQWLMEAQTFILFDYSKHIHLNDMQVDVLLDALSSLASNLSDKQFFQLTKAMVSLLLEMHPGTMADNFSIVSCFLRGVLHCSIQLGYLKGKCVVNCLKMLFLEEETFQDLAEMAPSFSEAAVWCVCSLVSPFSQTRVDLKQLSQLIHLIQTFQIPLAIVQQCRHKQSVSEMIHVLEIYTQTRSEKGLEQIMDELSKSNFLTDREDLLQLIKDCLSSSKLSSTSVVNVTDIFETRKALKRITNGSDSVSIDDVVIVLKNLSCAVHNCRKYRPRLTQLAALCVLLFSDKKKINHLLEVFTGEGKSCIIAMFAAVLGLQGRKVDIVTSSPLLAERDFKHWKHFFTILGLTADCNNETEEFLSLKPTKADVKRVEVYQHDVVYGTVTSFSADILRDEFEMRDIRRNRGFQAVIVDEVDMLMLDEGVQFTYLSHRAGVLRHIEPVLAMVWSAVRQNKPILTANGDDLFVGIPNHFHKVIFCDMDADESSTKLLQLASRLRHSPQLANIVKQIANTEDINNEITQTLGTKAMQLLVNLLNSNGVLLNHIKAYILDDNGIAKQISESDKKTKHSRQVLLLDKGVAVPMFTKAKLANGVETMVLDHCDLSHKKERLITTDGTLCYPGDAMSFDEVVSECMVPLHTLVKVCNVQGKTKEALDARNEEDQNKVMETFSTEDMILLIDQLNSSGVTHCEIVAFTLEEDTKLKQVSQRTGRIKDQHPVPKLLVLVQNNGKLKQLYRKNEIDTLCGVDLYMDTTDGSVYYSGEAEFFSGVLSLSLDLLHVLVKLDIVTVQDDTVKQVMDDKDEEKRSKALKGFRTESMLYSIHKLNGSGVAHNVIAYTSDASGNLNKVSEGVHEDQHSISVLVEDNGILQRLYTREEINTSQAEVLHTEDGAVYHRGVPQTLDDLLSHCLDPAQILDLLVKADIAQEKARKVMDATDNKSRNKAMENFQLEDIVHILTYLESHLPCKFAAYSSNCENRVLHPVHVPSENLESQMVHPLIIYDQGKLSLLHDIQDEHVRDDVMSTPDGSRFRPGPQEYFHNALLKCINPTQLLHLIMKTDFQVQVSNFKFHYRESLLLDLLRNVNKQDILKNLPHLQNLIRFKPTVYTLRGEKVFPSEHTPESKSKETKPEICILLLENGILCRLNVKEKVAIPDFLKDFVVNQLPTYIESAFTAHLMTENREYLLSEDHKILPIDFQNSGVIETNKRWGGGLQQMLELKHHLQLSPVSVITNFLSHLGFFSRYIEQGALYGISGTIGSDSEMCILQSKNLYDLQITKIPTCQDKLLYERKEVFVEGDRIAWLDKVHSVLQEAIAPKQYMSPCLPGAAALVLCEDICTASEISKYLSSKGQKTIPYTRNDLKTNESFNEANIIRPGDIIVATNLAGRGTDIRLTDEVNQSGGLFCLMTFLPRNKRVELQAFGRTARQGRPGSVQYILPVSALPMECKSIPDMSSIRDLREQDERSKLERMVGKDVQVVRLREKLFQVHCAKLKQLQNNPAFRHGKNPLLVKNLWDLMRFESKLLADTAGKSDLFIVSVNENWGQWLQTKCRDIESLRDEDSLREELEREWDKWWPQPRNPYEIYPSLQKCNFHHLVQFGNRRLFGECNVLTKAYAKEAYRYYTMAIEQETQFTMIAYYNRACCTLTTAEGDYIRQGIDDLKRAKELLEVYSKEVIYVHQCATVGCLTVGTSENLLLKQMEVRKQLLHHFHKTIDKNIDKLEEMYKNGDEAIVVTSSILQFIPEADMVTNEELYGLKFLGLEVSFKVKKKPKFTWAALFVFILGVIQVAVGACLTIFTAGVLSSVGMGLISEGISDCIDGAWGMVTGDFDLQDWAISKACSITLSIALGGVGKFVAKGTKAAVSAAKAAKGLRSGAKAFGKSVKQTLSVAKGTIKETAQEVGRMGKVVTDSWGKTLVTSAKKTGKLVAKEFISQGALYVLTKVESEVIEQIFQKIGEGFASRMKPHLQDSFCANGVNDLGRIVDLNFVSDDHQKSPILETEAENEFASIAEDVVSSIVNSDSTIFDEAVSVFRDNILPGISEHLKGKAAAISQVFQLGFVVNSINTMTDELSCLIVEFQPEMMRDAKARFKTYDESRDYQAIAKLDHVKQMKERLADRTAHTFGEAVTTVLQKSLSWILNHGMRMTANKLTSRHINKFIDIEGTRQQVTSYQKANYLRSRASEYVDIKAIYMKSHAKKVLNPDTPGTWVELKVAVEKSDCKVTVVIKDEKGRRPVYSHQSSGGQSKDKPEIILVYTPPKGDFKGHYDVEIDGETVSVKSQGNSCMFDAFARGLNHATKGDHIKAIDVRQLVHDEISQNPELWYDLFQRKEQLQRSRDGQQHLLQGAGPQNREQSPLNDHNDIIPNSQRPKRSDSESPSHNTDRRIIEDSYEIKRSTTDPKEEIILYKQENGIEFTSNVRFSEEPTTGSQQTKKQGKTVVNVENTVKLDSMEVKAKNCTFHHKEEHSGAPASFKQIKFTRKDRDAMGKSGPESCHLVASVHGGRAGRYSGNSAVGSKDYNQKETPLRNEIKNVVTAHYNEKGVGSRAEQKFNVTVKAEFEDLIPPASMWMTLTGKADDMSRMKKFVKERNKEIDERNKEIVERNKKRSADKQIALISLVEGEENIKTLLDRLKKASKIAHGMEINKNGEEPEPLDGIPQIQRFKSARYEVSIPGPPDSEVKLKLFGKDSYDLGRDTELLLHPELTGNSQGFKNKDLLSATPHTKTVHTAAVTMDDNEEPYAVHNGQCLVM